MDQVHVPMLSPVIIFDTNPTDYSPVKQMQLRRGGGTRCLGFGGIDNRRSPRFLSLADWLESALRLSGGDS